MANTNIWQAFSLAKTIKYHGVLFLYHHWFCMLRPRPKLCHDMEMSAGWHNESYVKSLWWYIPDSKVHGANMGPTWVLSAPDGPHVGHMNFAIRLFAIICSVYAHLHDAFCPHHRSHLVITFVHCIIQYSASAPTVTEYSRAGEIIAWIYNNYIQHVQWWEARVFFSYCSGLRHCCREVPSSI